MSYTYFWRTANFGSQWHPSPFTEQGVLFRTAEHYMMYHKALLFGDHQVAPRILAEVDPRAVKRLGRKVARFDPVVWNQHKVAVVTEGNLLKFAQSSALREELLATRGTQLVEASPYDNVWGIGLDEAEARLIPPHEWPGENLLGKVLDHVRSLLDPVQPARWELPDYVLAELTAKGLHGVHEHSIAQYLVEHGLYELSRGAYVPTELGQLVLAQVSTLTTTPTSTAHGS